MYSSYQQFTILCRDGTSGDPLTRSATATSIISQTDADEKALGLAQELAYREMSCDFPAELPAARHSADYDGDWRISAAEITRLSVLYGYTANHIRTGEYHTDSSTIDGFAPGPGIIETYHSADSNHNGKISLLELLAVIAISNYNPGGGITGEYHVDAGDPSGFSAGPGDRPGTPMYSSQVTATANSTAGHVVETFSVTLLAGAIVSYVSYADANAAAAIAAQVQANQLRDANQRLLYSSAEVSVSGSCGSGFAPYTTTVTVAAAAFTSPDSQAAADVSALAHANAILAGSLSDNCNQTYYCAPTSYTAECNGGLVGDPVTVIAPYGSYTSLIDQGTADAAASAAIAIAAEALVVCAAGYYNVEQTFTATCENQYGGDWVGFDVTVIVPAGTYSAPLQVDADALALADATAAAIAQLTCHHIGG